VGRSGIVAALMGLLLACGQGAGRGPPASGLPGTGGGTQSGSEDGGTGGLPPQGDAGFGVPDAGTDAGAPVDAGPGLDGGVDAGAPPIDGGGSGPAACADPAPADVCSILAPPLGTPVVHTYPERLDGGYGENVFCGAGAYPASGTGVVLHPVQVQGRPPSFAFVDRTGQDIATYGNFSLATVQIDVVPQGSGFGILGVYEGGMGSYGVVFIDDRAAGRGATLGARVTALPGAGVGVINAQWASPSCEPAQDTLLTVQRFEETGSAALASPTHLACYDQSPDVAIAGNAEGQVLVLASAFTGTWTGWDGYWLDRDLRLVQRFTIPELTAPSANAELVIAPLLDGSFVLRLGGTWTYRLQPGATAVEPAPCWLASRPATELALVRGGTAYASLHRGSEECDRVVEVLTPEGKTCGFVPVSGTDGRCELAVGRDGTLSKGAVAVGGGAGQPRSCVLEFWPAALGPTGN
jgi:hypothetical protein